MTRWQLEAKSGVRCWEKLDSSRARDDGSAGAAVRVTDVPLPLRRPCAWDTARSSPARRARALLVPCAGYDVMNPIGWDSFGLPAGRGDPQQRAPGDLDLRQHRDAGGVDAQVRGVLRLVETTAHVDPEYYRWTQWLFLRMRERGLAYRKSSPVNWCPTDQTVLANEQVINGKCERCGSDVTKRELTQWYFKTTEYAQRLLDDMSLLEGKWPNQVLTMQRNWIGRSRARRSTSTSRPSRVTDRPSGRSRCSRPDRTRCSVRRSSSSLRMPRWPTSCAPTVIVPTSWPTARKCRSSSDIERLATDRPKSGVFLGRYAVNPVNGERIPVWASDYVLAHYGTGRSDGRSRPRPA